MIQGKCDCERAKLSISGTLSTGMSGNINFDVVDTFTLRGSGLLTGSGALRDRQSVFSYIGRGGLHDLAILRKKESKKRVR